jgi:hypothetical protein
MTHAEFKTWLDAYGHAWETRDANAAAGLFSDDAAYHATPFVEPLRGRAEILAYWTHVGRSQEQIRFRYEILAIANENGIAHWRASFNRHPEGTRVNLDGIFVITLNAERKCMILREWWQRKQVGPGPIVELSPNVRRSSPLLPDRSED